MTTSGMRLGEIICCSVVSFVFGLILLFCILSYSDNYEYKETECYVNKVEYPTFLINETHTDHWARCDCGKSCKAWNPYVNVYVTIDNEEYRARYKNTLGDDGYTFFDYDCPKGENIVETLIKFDEAQDLYHEYFNTTRFCHFSEDKGIVYLEYSDFSYIYVLVFGILFSMCCLTTLCLCYFRNDKEDHTSSYAV